MALTKVTNDLQDALAAAQPTITSTGTLTGFTSTGIDDNATSTAITIDASENVGIGVTPTARLDIAGMAAGEVGLQITSPRNDALTNGLAYINVTDSVAPFAALKINHAGTGPAIVALGDVGIGTSSPRSVTNYSVVGINGTSGSAIDFELGEALNTTMTQTASQFEINVVPALPLIFKTSNSERMKIDGSGRVTMPSQPAFDVHHSGGSYASGTTVTSLDLNTVRLNRGNHYSASNDRFIAPVAGVYVFYYRAIISGTYTNLHIRFRKNGVHIAGGDTHASPTTSGWSQMSSQILLQLAVNDYVQVEHTTNTNIYGDSYQTFQGHLLG